MLELHAVNARAREAETNARQYCNGDVIHGVLGTLRIGNSQEAAKGDEGYGDGPKD